jgi:hypothetical protein
MPPDAPLTVDVVRSGMAWIELSGRIHWSEAARENGQTGEGSPRSSPAETRKDIE